MKLTRKANIVGALMIAGGSIATGASVTSGAMAADDGGDSTVDAVVIGSTSADGDAYQCVFDDLELPTTDGAASPEVPEGAEAGILVTGGVVDGTGTQIVTNIGDDTPMPPGAGPFDVVVGEDGRVTATNADGTPIEPDDLQVGVAVAGGGSVSIDGSGTVIMSSVGELPDGEVPLPPGITPVEVREGSSEECAALLEQTTALPVPPAVPAVPSMPGASTEP